MPDPRRPENQREVLSHDASERLFARAAELDVAEKAGAEVDKLRAAAVEAGISPTAFDAALDEMHVVPQALPAPRRRRRSRIITFIAGVAVAFGALIVVRGADTSTPATIEQSFTLRCLTVNDATKLVEPILGQRFNRLSFSKSAPQTINIVATKEQVEQISAVIAREDAACTVQPSSR